MLASFTNSIRTKLAQHNYIMREDIPVELGVPYGDCQYGLYFYPKNRFLFVGSNESIIDLIRSLLSSKLFLSKLSIHTFENWDHGLIDNSVCSNWGVTFNDSSPVLTDYREAAKDLQELEFFASMIYWIELSLQSLIESKPKVLGETLHSAFESNLSLIDDNNVSWLIANDKQRSDDFDAGTEQICQELRKICYWAKSKEELINKLADFVKSNNTYAQLFHKEILHWWKLN